MALMIAVADAAQRERALAWVHGVGRPAVRAGRSELQDLIEKVCRADLFNGTPAASTTSAEAVLGWGESIYWYIGTTNRAFGALSIGEWNPQPSLSLAKSEASICPFDTGGLLVHPARYDCGIDAHAPRIAYVDRHVTDLGDWHATVRKFLTSAYADFADYVDGHPPNRHLTEHPHSNFDVAVADGRPWSWEARLTKSAYPTALREPDRLYWHDNADRLAALAEARRAMSSGMSEAASAANVIAARSTVSAVSDAHASVQEALKSRASVV
ncbi:MAG TPA: hypothetical protein VGW38_01085 [Chloroflexota bacterium]|nr:hypothetical protein [Chloroflexota bacterium]